MYQRSNATLILIVATLFFYYFILLFIFLFLFFWLPNSNIRIFTRRCWPLAAGWCRGCPLWATWRWGWGWRCASPGWKWGTTGGRRGGLPQKSPSFAGPEELGYTNFFRVLFENRPALYFCNYTENEKNNTRMLDTLFIDDFIDIMEQFFLYYNHDWQCKKLNTTEKT